MEPDSGVGRLPVRTFLPGGTTMTGIKQRDFRPLPDDLSLEGLVPKGNLYRRLEERTDLSFVRELVLPLYAGGSRRRRSRRDKPDLDRPVHGPITVLDAQLGEDALHVELDGTQAVAEMLGRLPVRQPRRDEA